jgi:hypothetical protein
MNKSVNSVNKIGKKTFQQIVISWLYRYLGNVARIKIKLMAKPIIKNNKYENEEKKSNVVNMQKNIILPYSPKKNIAKRIAEYSRLYPATISASASGKSNGARLVSAMPPIKKKKKKEK